MTAQLNQIIAIEKSIKSRVYASVGELHKVLQKGELFNGFVKSYSKKDDAGEDFPNEKKNVQFNVADVLNQVEKATTELLDVTAKKDWTNCTANGDVVVDGKTIIANAPVSYLLFLEKQLNDFKSIAESLPVLDNAEVWELDDNSGLFNSESSSTHRTKKVQKPIVMYDATKEHPAQTQMITEDVVVGYWKQVKQSGAISKPVKLQLIERVETLIIAVKEARERANMQDVVDVPSVGDAIFKFLLP